METETEIKIVPEALEKANRSLRISYWLLLPVALLIAFGLLTGVGATILCFLAAAVVDLVGMSYASDSKFPIGAISAASANTAITLHLIVPAFIIWSIINMFRHWQGGVSPFM